MENKDLMPIPQVLLFDCSDEIDDDLTKHRYSVKKASFGKDVNIEYDWTKKASLPLIWSTPSNIHEYEVIVVDMCGVDDGISIKDLPTDHSNPLRFSIKYPNKVFYTSAITSSKVFRGTNKPKKAIYIIFEGEYVIGSYDMFDIRKEIYSGIEGGTYDFFDDIIEYKIGINKKIGKRTKVAENTKLSSILKKYNESFQYLATYYHPVIYDTDTRNTVERADFLPLVFNDNNEIVSFICLSKDNVILVLPQTNRKSELLIELLEDFFPGILPEFFPESTKFLWLSDRKYALPNTNAFEERKQAARGEYEAKVKKIDEEIQENNEQFGFLHDLLKETDDLLVKAVIAWFKWLGYQNIIDVDQEKGTKREDINIVEDDCIIIAEVKGIGGTSTDDECSQIRKHRRRFEKENKGKDIIPIYIVNHQRYISPELRRNPPFTKEQIEYAKHDERGLITTYQLFIWHKLVCEGIFNPDEIKEVFTQFGAIPLIPPQYIFLGVIKEYFAKSKALILSLDNCEIKTGDTLLFEKDGFLQKSEILSIQDSGVFVEKTANGEVGISVDLQLGKGFSAYLCPRSK
jgi:hypothetical protein